MDLRKLKTLIDLVSESNVSELEITEAEGRVRIVKGAASAAVSTISVPVATPSMAAPVVVSSDVQAAAALSAVSIPAADAHVVKSPMVGTFDRVPLLNKRLSPWRG